MGIASAVLAKSDPSASIITYEANPQVLPAINELHKLNDLSNVTAFNALLLPDASESQTMAFNLHANFTEGSIRDVESSEQIQVSVAEFQKTFDEHRPDIFICNIERGEAEFFKNISLKGLRGLVLELHPELIGRRDIKAIYDLCAEAGLYLQVDLSDKRVEVFETIAEVS